MNCYKSKEEDKGSPPDRLGNLRDVQKLISLGATCELGLLKRWCGHDSAGLFQFAHTSVRGLCQALRLRFDRIGDPKCISITADSRTGEYIAKHTFYGFSFQTFANVSRASETSVREYFVRHLPVRARELAEDIEAGQRLLVFRPAEENSIEDGYLLLDALGGYGRQSLLLMLSAETAAQVGTAAIESDGLFVGYIDGPSEIPGSSLQPWLSACCEAIELWKRPRPSAFLEF
jgi:hypothetical protein